MHDVGYALYAVINGDVKTRTWHRVQDIKNEWPGKSCRALLRSMYMA